MDPDNSCYVRCSATEPYKGENSTTETYGSEGERKAKAFEELYLFVELVTVIRVMPCDLKHDKRRFDKIGRDGRDDERDEDRGERNRGDKGKERSSSRADRNDRDNRDSRDNRNNGPGDSARPGAVRMSTDSTRGRTNSAVDVTKSASFFSRFSRKPETKGDVSGVNKSVTELPKKDNMQSDMDDGENSPMPGGRGVRRSTSRRGDGDGGESPERRGGDRGTGGRGDLDFERRFDDEDREGRNGRDGRDADGQEEAPVVVEMCSGWVMIPIAATLRGNVRKLRLPMYGGTPFAVVNIQGKGRLISK